MKNTAQILAAVALAASVSFSAFAADLTAPEIRSQNFQDSGILFGLTENGEWSLVSFGSSDLQEVGTPKILNVPTGKYENIQTAAEIEEYGKQTFNDITNDGNIVVGALTTKATGYVTTPAYFNRTTREWTTLPIPAGCDGAFLTKVTPDGRYAIGRGAKAEDMWFSSGAMWDLQTGVLIDLPNLPVLDMTHENQNQQQLTSISEDGRFIIGSLSYSYLYPAAPCVFIYDRETSEAKFIGFDPSDTEDWKPWVEGVLFIDEAYISPNGKYVALHVRLFVNGGAGASEVDTFAVGYYEVETGKFEILKDSRDMGCSFVDNNGIVYAASPSDSPIREWSVYKGGYWYSIDKILLQGYGVNFAAASKYTNTGTIMGLSGDGKTFAVMSDPRGDSYTLRMPTAPAEICDKINLLANPSIAPADGLSFTKLRSIELTFERNVEVIGSINAASLTKEDGTLVRNSSNIAVGASSKNTVVVTFRPTELANGQKYSVTIPAGVISVAGDPNKTNEEITVNYIGRADVAVKAINIYPKDGSVLAKFDNNSSAIYITYDTPLLLSETAAARLYHLDGDNLEKVCDLRLLVEDNILAVYPSSAQYLYLDQKYKVVIDAKAVTDYSQSGASEAIELNYTGSYVREISHDNANLFIDDFSNQSQSLINFMRYEGDHNTPTDEMAAIGFDKDNQPWNFSISESNTSTDYCAASTSMYSPAGKSDDWMVIPQLEIPDEYVTLSFKAQSYKFGKEDRLKVYIWTCDENFSALSTETMGRLKAEAVLVFDELLTPGSDEEKLVDGWVDYSVDLAAYAGKKIYIAFCNDNDNQSCVFVDNVAVTRAMKFFVSLVTAESVVAQDDVLISGKLTANADGETFTSAHLTLKDSAGNVVDEINATDLSLAKGQSYTFKFEKKLSLEIGKINKYQIAVEMGKYADKVDCTIKNLAFRTTKRIVLEEFTGITCKNCPLGHLGIEHLRGVYGDNFIPVGIHTYQGDPYAHGLSGYSAHFNLVAAPSGVIQRNGVISFPMSQDPILAEYVFSDGATLWADHAAAEMEIPADIDLALDYTINEADNKFDLTLAMTSAIEQTNMNLNVFVVMLEDHIIADFQENTFYNVSDPALGEWGKGGKYATDRVYEFPLEDVAMACWGSSFDGTPGLLPQSIAAGETVIVDTQLAGFDIPETVEKIENTKVVVMVIDGNTDKIVNAVCTKAFTESGVENVAADGNGATIYTAGNAAYVVGAGDVSAAIYTIDGKLVNTAAGTDSVSLSAGGYTGVAVVRAVVGGNVTTKKVIF